jgi:hypothetical protein
LDSPRILSKILSSLQYQDKRSSKRRVSGQSLFYTHPLLPRWGAVIFDDLSQLTDLSSEKSRRTVPFFSPTHSLNGRVM